MSEIKPTTPTEHLIVELTSKMTRYEMALQGCLMTARNGLLDEDESPALYLRFIEHDVMEALYGGKEMEE